MADARRRAARILAHIDPEATSSKASAGASKAKTINYASLDAKTAKQMFEAVYERLAAELIADLDQFEVPDESKQYIRRMLDHNLPGGKLNRGLSVVSTYAHLVGGRPLTEDEVFRASVLGWCVEWLQAFFLVADDVMDKSLVRRDKPCWYRMEGVGLIAVNDAFIIEMGVYRLLKRHFATDACYLALIECFHEVTYQTELGQMMDLRTSPEGAHGPTLHNFSLHKHTLVVKYKTAFYSFYLPVALGMILAGVSDKKLYDTARDVLVDMGIYFQVQDDFLDWWQDPAVLGKVGTDIQDNKCSWPVVQVLERCSPADRAVLEANYARNDPAAIATVKGLYKKYDVEGIYRRYEDAKVAELNVRIRAIKNLPAAVFTDFLDKIAYRQK